MSTHVTSGQSQAPAPASPAPAVATGPVHELGSAAPANALFGIIASMSKVYELTKDQKDLQGDAGELAVRAAIAKWMGSDGKVTASQMKAELDNLLKNADKYSPATRAMLEDLDRQVTDYKGPQYMIDSLDNMQKELESARDDAFWKDMMGFFSSGSTHTTRDKCNKIENMEEQKRAIDQFGGQMVLKSAEQAGNQANSGLATVHAAQTDVETTIEQTSAMSKALELTAS